MHQRCNFMSFSFKLSILTIADSVNNKQTLHRTISLVILHRQYSLPDRVVLRFPTYTLTTCIYKVFLKNAYIVNETSWQDELTSWQLSRNKILFHIPDEDTHDYSPYAILPIIDRIITSIVTDKSPCRRKPIELSRGKNRNSVNRGKVRALWEQHTSLNAFDRSVLCKLSAKKDL